jgi:hypothetical protein
MHRVTAQISSWAFLCVLICHACMHLRWHMARMRMHMYMDMDILHVLSSVSQTNMQSENERQHHDSYCKPRNVQKSLNRISSKGLPQVQTT